MPLIQPESFFKTRLLGHGTRIVLILMFRFAGLKQTIIPQHASVRSYQIYCAEDEDEAARL